MKKVFKKKQSCGLFFSKLCYTSIFLLDIFCYLKSFKHEHLFHLRCFMSSECTLCYVKMFSENDQIA